MKLFTLFPARPLKRQDPLLFGCMGRSPTYATFPHRFLFLLLESYWVYCHLIIDTGSGLKAEWDVTVNAGQDPTHGETLESEGAACSIFPCSFSTSQPPLTCARFTTDWHAAVTLHARWLHDSTHTYNLNTFLLELNNSVDRRSADFNKLIWIIFSKTSHLHKRELDSTCGAGCFGCILAFALIS